MARPLRPSARCEYVNGGGGVVRVSASLVRLARAGERAPALWHKEMRWLCLLLMALSQVAAAPNSHNPVPPLNGQSAQVSAECARRMPSG